MSKQLFKVVQVTIQAGQEAAYVPIRNRLTEGKAKALRDSLESKQGDYDPSKPLVSYLIQPSN
jgi:hypothetical protein